MKYRREKLKPVRYPLWGLHLNLNRSATITFNICSSIAAFSVR